MQDQPAANEIEEHREQVVLTLLLDPGLPPLWSVEELGRQLGDAVGAADAVDRLHRAGLVHRCQEFVFATRAAARFARLVGGL